jgi:hypothetical protein
MATFEEVINQPAVKVAYEILIRAGLIQPPARAEVLCAWCGVHIIFCDPTDTGFTPPVLDAVTAHRATCEKYTASLHS